jgi:thioesterase domain-containing protein
MASEGDKENSRKDRLSELKRRLLKERLHGIALPKGIEPIRPRLAGTRVPLSAEQRPVWLHTSQQPELPIYNEPFTIHRYGSFDLGIFEASMNEVLRRHEAWRTSFSPEGEEVIHQTVRVTLPFVDLSGLPPVEREAEALRLATEDAQNPIPLHTVPLFRAHVVRMKADEHRLYLTVHHIIFDAISISRIFVPELSAIYAAFEQGSPSPLPAPALQYGDYAVWREGHVESPVVKQHLAYWRDQLSGELPVLRLPEDRPRPAIASHRGSMECFEIPAELVDKLRRLSHEQGTTLYMTLLAAFKVLLFRYSGQNDLIVGSATDARRRPELEAVMGYFVDTFAIRTRPVAELRFSEYLATTRDAVLEGLAAADVPFDRVVQGVNPKRETSHHPIFQAFFSTRPPIPHFAEGWNLSQMDVTVGTSKFVLHLELCERPDHVEARFLYSTDIWDASTIRRMATHWLVLLQSVCQNPESTLGTLTILSQEEAANHLGTSGWNHTSRAFPAGDHDLSTAKDREEQLQRRKVDRARLPAPTGSETLPPPPTPSSSQEMRLAAIWAGLLGRKHVGLDDNFFDVGGYSLLVAALQVRIATEFGQRVPMTELFHSPTVRQQAELLQRLLKGNPGLPPGVLALQPYGTHSRIFWVQSSNGELAKAIGDEHPSLVLTLTAEDVASLGEAPSLQSIARCHVRKILATQSEGPCAVGGLCASGILAYEIASQLQAAGNEVSLLVLLDAPNPSCMKSWDTLRPGLAYLRYHLKRAALLGRRTSLIYLRNRLRNRFARMVRRRSARTEMRIAQDMIEAAILAYRPKKYEGRALLLLASDHPPHMNILPGWRALVPRNLHAQYVDGYHRNLLDTRNVRTVADAIVSHLTTGESPNPTA